ncbi:MAG TPA: isochorismatase family protein [Pirellulales bacterium]|nr:isochorismatase family protein [Pirellulales bacterium]
MIVARPPLAVLAVLLAMPAAVRAEEAKSTKTYENRLAPIDDPRPILADYPEFVEPVVCPVRFEAPPLVDDDQADLAVRAWRFSYNLRGVVELPNRLKGRDTAVIVVHPWGIDDGQGWTTPQPAGIAFQCTVEKNEICNRHMAQVVNPLLKKLRDRVGLVLYSLPGVEDPIRKQVYRSFRGKPSDLDRKAGAKALTARLRGFDYHGEALPSVLTLSEEHPVSDYFRQFGGTDSSDRFNAEGFWKLPIPVNKNIQVAPDDVVIYDGEGYGPLRDFLREQGIRHVLLTGYNTDMCFCATTAGYDNLSPDFNVFLVGDATLATFPANPSPRFATNASISLASREHLITQASWIEINP